MFSLASLWSAHVLTGQCSRSIQSLTSQSPAVTIGGIPANVQFSGLTPTAVGLYQINAVVPSNVPPGTAVPVVVTVGTQSSQLGVTIAVQ